MRLLSKLFCAACLIIAASQALSAQSKDPPPRKDIVVCRIELTEIGRRPNFHFNFIYALDVKNDGSIEQVKKLREKAYPPFVRENKIIECIEKWKLEPAGQYVVNVSFGTSGAENSITIVPPNRESVLKLILPKD